MFSRGHFEEFLPAFQLGVPLPEGGPYSYVRKFGRNREVDSGVTADIYDNGFTGGVLLYPFTAAARAYAVLSTDTVNDTSDGTGARTIQVFGLDDNYDEISETATLTNGAAVLSNEYIRIYRAVVTSAGSGGANQGDIRITSSIPELATSANILAGDNQTLQAVYTIPNGKVGWLLRTYAYVNRAQTTGAMNIRTMVRPFGQVFQVKKLQGLQAAGTSGFDHRWVIPLKLEAKSDIIMRCASGANNMDVSAGFDIVLVNDPFSI